MGANGYTRPGIPGTDFMACPVGLSSQYIKGDGTLGDLSALLSSSVTAAYGSGTGYTVTTTPALTTFSVTNPTVTLPTTGNYVLIPNVSLQYIAATFLTSRTVTLKLRKTSGTAADVSNSVATVLTQLVTLLSFTVASPQMPPVGFSGTAGDIISIFASIDVAPTAGTIQVVAASILAIKLPN